jgi:tRNA(Ile)-lysidine synthetase-like protein
LLIGVSGGQDSLCLAHAIRLLTDVHRWDLHLVHVDHAIRPEAAAEASYVAALAERWGLPCTVARVDVPAYRRRHRLNVQAAARYARYQAFARLADKLGAAGVLVAHTADDVAETLLLHLLRGAGLDGLAASPLVQTLPPAALGPPLDAAPLPPALRVLRPLLAVARADTAAYCAEHSLVPVGEPPGHYRRDRVREELLPVLARYNPRVREALAATAEAAREEREALDRWTDALWNSLNQDGEPGLGRSDAAWTIALDAWRGLPAAMQKRLLRRAAVELAGVPADLGRRHLDAALALAQSQAGRAIALPGGLRLKRLPKHLRLARPSAQPPRPPGPWMLAVPGQVVLPGVGVLRADRRLVTADAHPNLPADRHEAWLAADALPGALMVRWRRPGDRFQPLGLPRAKRLQDFLVDSRVPRERRDRLPLVAVGADGDAIAWVAGERIAHWARLRPETREAVRLTFERDESTPWISTP